MSENSDSRLGEKATPQKEFSFYHQKEVLMHEIGFASIIDATQSKSETMKFHSLADVGEIPYNFKIGSTMIDEEFEGCMWEYLIP